MESQFASAKTTEAINLNEVSSLLMQRGYMVYRPEADVGGVDFLVGSPYGVVQKCQLKSRAFVQWGKYGARGIHMVFPGQGEAGAREWYLIPHDKLFDILKGKHGDAPKWDHPVHGEYWHCPVSKDLAGELEGHAINNPKVAGAKQLFNHELRREMFEIDSKVEWQKCSALGYSINGYALLPDQTGMDIMSALLRQYERGEVDETFELTSLRLIFFFLLRRYHHTGYIDDDDYTLINKVMGDIRNSLPH